MTLGNLRRVVTPRCGAWRTLAETDPTRGSDWGRLASVGNCYYAYAMFTFGRPLTICLTLAVPLAAHAHPHVFVDTGLTLILDDSRNVTAVEVTWKYDDLYSLLIMQDMGLDEDADGILTDDEMAQIEGWDMKWMEGYQGDLYLTGPDGRAIALAGPEPIATEVEEARLLSRHRRTLSEPVPAADLVLRAYDPEFYTAYDLTLGVSVPEPCTKEISTPDQDEAYAEAQELMSAFPEDAENVPLLGHVFAETVTIQCSSEG